MRLFLFFLLHLSFTRLSPSPSGFGLETFDGKSDVATKKDAISSGDFLFY